MSTRRPTAAERVQGETENMTTQPSPATSASSPSSRGTVAVTGGSSGIGRAVVRRMLADGHPVINLDRQAPPALLAGETWIEVDHTDVDATRAAAIRATILARRMGEPDEVAHIAASLLDDRAGFITGQVLYVCGGMTVGLANA